MFMYLQFRMMYSCENQNCFRLNYFLSLSTKRIIVMSFYIVSLKMDTFIDFVNRFPVKLIIQHIVLNYISLSTKLVINNPETNV